jgi:beta-galactosidase
MPETEWSVLLPTAHDKAPDGDWLYTIENPGEDFIQTEFDAASWKSGKPGFGSIGADLRGAEWNTGEIWLRKTVEYDGEGFDVAVLITWFDDDTEIYLNGKLLWNHDRWNTRYEAFEVTRPILETLRKGKNTFAVHTRQDKGGQYIDAGILLGSFVDVKAKSSE